MGTFPILRPFRAFGCGTLFPRALPWAGFLQPFRLKLHPRLHGAAGLTGPWTPWRDSGEGGQGSKNPYFYSGLWVKTLPANLPFLVAGRVRVPFLFGGNLTP